MLGNLKGAWDSAKKGVQAGKQGDWHGAVGHGVAAIASTKVPMTDSQRAGAARLVETGAHKVENFVKDPEVQAKAREAVHKAGEIGGAVANKAGEFGAEAGRRFSAFVAGHTGARSHEHQQPAITAHDDSGY